MGAFGFGRLAGPRTWQGGCFSRKFYGISTNTNMKAQTQLFKCHGGGLLY